MQVLESARHYTEPFGHIISVLLVPYERGIVKEMNAEWLSNLVMYMTEVRFEPSVSWRTYEKITCRGKTCGWLLSKLRVKERKRQFCLLHNVVHFL